MKYSRVYRCIRLKLSFVDISSDYIYIYIFVNRENIFIFLFNRLLRLLYTLVL